MDWLVVILKTINRFKAGVKCEKIVFLLVVSFLLAACGVTDYKPASNGLYLGGFDGVREGQLFGNNHDSSG